MTHLETVSSPRNQQPLVNRQAIYRLLEYLAAHGHSLSAVLRQVRADPDVKDIRQLEDLADTALSGNSDDAGRLAQNLQSLVNEMLFCVGDVMCDVDGAYMGADFDNGLRWHAARLHDLARGVCTPAL